MCVYICVRVRTQLVSTSQLWDPLTAVRLKWQAVIVEIPVKEPGYFDRLALLVLVSSLSITRLPQ